MNGPVPPAVTLNVAVVPWHAVTLAGVVVVVDAFTVRVALEVAVPHVPLTTTLIDAAEPLRVRFRRRGRLRQDSDLLIDQIRAIDNRRLVGRPLCRAPQAFMTRVGTAIREVLDLVD